MPKFNDLLDRLAYGHPSRPAPLRLFPFEDGKPGVGRDPLPERLDKVTVAPLQGGAGVSRGRRRSN